MFRRRFRRQANHSTRKVFHAANEGDVRRENVLKNDEIITEIQVPASKFAAHSTYLKFKERDSLDFALASVAAAVTLGPNKTVSEARLVLGGVAPIPWRVPRAEAALIGKTMSNEVLRSVAEIALDGAKPLEKNAYKVPLTQTTGPSRAGKGRRSKRLKQR